MGMFDKVKSGIDKAKTMHAEFNDYRDAKSRYADALLLAASAPEGISPEEARQISELAESLAIKESDRRSLGADSYGKLKKQAVEDGRISAEELSQLRALQSFLGLSDRDADSVALDRLRTLTACGEGDLPVIDVSVNLPAGELGHYETPAQWAEIRTVRQRVAGTRAKTFKITKGVKFKVPATSGHTTEHNELNVIDRGKVVVTSKRLIFLGPKKNLNLPLEKLLDLELYKDAITVHRGTANPTILKIGDPQMLYAVLSGAVNK